jgi:hypothetical protein
MKLKRDKVNELLQIYFNGKNSKFADAIGVEDAHLRTYIRTEVGDGRVLIGGIIKFCKEKELSIEDYIETLPGDNTHSIDILYLNMESTHKTAINIYIQKVREETNNEQMRKKKEQLINEQIREVREQLEKETAKGNLQVKLIFALSREVDELVLQLHNQGLYEARAQSPEEARVKGIINQYLRQMNLKLDDLKNKGHLFYRYELIVKLRVDEGFTVCETARYLGLNEYQVGKSIETLKQKIANKRLNKHGRFVIVNVS